MPNDREQPRTFLPERIPSDFRDFVRCDTDSIDIAPGQLDWLPNLPTLTLSFEEGAQGSITIRVVGADGWMDFSIPLFIVDGRLVADTSKVPALADNVDQWVNDFNGDLRANGKQLSGATIRGGRLQVTKEAVPVGTGTAVLSSASELPQPAMPIPPPPAHVTNPIPEPEIVRPPMPVPPPPAHVTDPIPEPVAVASDESIPDPDQAHLQYSHYHTKISVLKRRSKWGRIGALTVGGLVLSVSAYFIFVEGVEPPATTPGTGQESGSGVAQDAADGETPAGETSEQDSSDPASSGGADAAESSVDEPVVESDPDLSGVLEGQDPRAHIVSVDPAKGENSTVGAIVTFAQPLDMPLSGLFSYFFLMNFVVGDCSMSAGYETHAGTVTPVEPGPTYLLDDGSVFIDTGCPINPGELIIITGQSGSWEDEATTQPVFEDFTFQIDPAAIADAPPIDMSLVVYDLVAQTAMPGGGPP